MLSTLSPYLANTDSVAVYHTDGKNGSKLPADFCLNTTGSYVVSVDVYKRQLQGLDAGSKTFYTDVARQIEKIKASPIEKSKSDSFSPQKPAQEVENARYEILDAV